MNCEKASPGKGGGFGLPVSQFSILHWGGESRFFEDPLVLAIGMDGGDREVPVTVRLHRFKSLFSNRTDSMIN